MEAVKLDNFLKVDKGIPVPLYYQIKQGILPVSYTHLTLPTNSRV